MAVIHFRSGTSQTTVHVRVPHGARRTLLSVARDAGVPLLFNCEVGDCGACLVDVETRSIGLRPVSPLTEKERFLLQAQDRLSTANAAADRVAPMARLACQYEVHDEDIVVTFRSGLGA